MIQCGSQISFQSIRKFLLEFRSSPKKLINERESCGRQSPQVNNIYVATIKKRAEAIKRIYNRKLNLMKVRLKSSCLTSVPSRGNTNNNHRNGN